MFTSPVVCTGIATVTDVLSLFATTVEGSARTVPNQTKRGGIRRTPSKVAVLPDTVIEFSIGVASLRKENLHPDPSLQGA